MTAKPSIFSSPSRYVQGKNAMHELGTYLKQLGKNPLLLSDDTVWGLSLIHISEPTRRS